uniref:Spt4/RpoE2 zinc finger domain-containing protein n=1 Tax=Arcella intermedia TaxID=1963864 RepID=A0A6B2LT88_9EUKA
MYRLRACMGCGLVKETRQFQKFGCNNCTFLKIHGDGDRLESCTTTNFSGLISMMKPERSWVARWQRMRPNLVPGCYAVTVQGRLGPDMINILHENQVEYIPLDQED